MISLNLINKDVSDIGYEIIKYPDGQQNIKFQYGHDPEFSRKSYATISDMIKFGVNIKTRIKNFNDLEMLVCATRALKNSNIDNIQLVSPFIIGGRSDRKEHFLGVNYMKDVISPIINDLGFNNVITYHQHSFVTESVINKCLSLDNTDFVKHVLSHETNYQLVSPDAGALKNIYKLANKINHDNEVIVCSKYRDKDGNLYNTRVPNLDMDKDAIIIDDLCDGGRTFINIAKEMRKAGFNKRIILVVSHGIFSKGFAELNKHFDLIWTTNSYFDIDSEEFLVRNEKKINKLKQFKII